MKWIVTHALPPSSLAQALEQALLGSGPDARTTLDQLFEPFVATCLSRDPALDGCTPSERVWLETHGCPMTAATQGGLPIGSSMAAWQAGVEDATRPVWVAQACGTMISAERASLLPLEDLQANDLELQALHKAIEPLFEATGDSLRLEPLSPGLWRVHGIMPDGTWLATPQAVRGQDLGDWWPTDNIWRPWRKLMNEIQMCWHEHPVNIQRQEAGLPTINSLWLYGGAPGFRAIPEPDVIWIKDLAEPANQGDWGRWIEQYVQVARSLNEQIALLEPQTRQALEIILTGERRLVHLQLRQNTASVAGADMMANWRGRMARILSGLRRQTSQNTHQPDQPWSQWWNDA